MTQEEILEGNKLIAEFIYDDSFIDDGDGDCYCESPNGMIDFYIEDAKYDSSWDWLMPVVQKIESIHSKHHGYFGVHISSNTCNIRGTKLHLSITNPDYGFVYMSNPDAIFDSKIESTWYAVVKFIKWYNDEKNTD